jgi:predicted aspartyl protease
MMDQLLPVIFMIGVLLLVLPAFLQSNSKLKQFLTNLTVWIVIVLIILTIMYIFKNKYWLYEKAMLVIKTNALYTSIDPYRLPPA